jgi:hypothetical protein
MSLNKNLKFSDYKEVVVLGDAVSGSEDYKFLSDDPRTVTQKVVSSLFLKVRSKNNTTNESFFLILKPECLWLRILSGSIVDSYGTPEDKMINYAPYKAGEILKAFFLQSPSPSNPLTSLSIKDVMLFQGFKADVAPKALDSLFGLSQILLYDSNELNRSRISGSGNGSSSNTISRWL